MKTIALRVASVMIALLLTFLLVLTICVYYIAFPVYWIITGENIFDRNVPKWLLYFLK